MSLTHFLALPLFTPLSRPQLNASLHTFTTALRTDPSLAVPPRIAAHGPRPATTLHLTLAALDLRDPARLAAAVAVLRSLDLAALWRDARAASDIRPPTEVAQMEETQREEAQREEAQREDAQSNSAVLVTLKGIEAMRDPSRTSVLYAPPLDPSGDLQRFCEAVRERFAAAELLQQPGKAGKKGGKAREGRGAGESREDRGAGESRTESALLLLPRPLLVQSGRGRGSGENRRSRRSEKSEGKEDAPRQPRPSQSSNGGEASRGNEKSATREGDAPRQPRPSRSSNGGEGSRENEGKEGAPRQPRPSQSGRGGEASRDNEKNETREGGAPRPSQSSNGSEARRANKQNSTRDGGPPRPSQPSTPREDRSERRDQPAPRQPLPPLLLHATLLNTVYLPPLPPSPSPPPPFSPHHPHHHHHPPHHRPPRHPPRASFDATPVIARFGATVWLRAARLETLALCRMGARADAETGEVRYVVEAGVDMP